MLLVWLRLQQTFKLTVDDIANLDVGNGIFGEKRAKKIIEEIDKKRELTIDQFLGSLGIDHLGKRRVEIIRKAAKGKLDTVQDWLSGSIQKNADKLGIPNIAESIYDGLEKSNIHELLRAGVTIKKVATKKAVVDGKLSGTVFVLTGSFSRPKSELKTDIEAAGGSIGSSVSKKTSFLVQSDPTSTSSKSKKANELGVEIISEDHLMKLL